MMKRFLLLLPLLAACGTPQERCIATATREQRAIESLMAEVQGNLARGYAIEEYTTYEMSWQLCRHQPAPLPRPNGEPGKPLPSRMCWEEEPVTRERPRAIDLAAEAVKLEQLRDRRAALVQAAGPVIAQCRAQYPE